MSIVSKTNVCMMGRSVGFARSPKKERKKKGSHRHDTTRSAKTFHVIYTCCPFMRKETSQMVA